MKNGSIAIPDDFRERYGFEDGAFVVVIAASEGLVLRPADGPEPEIYTPERIAEFLLNNAVSERDYRAAVAEVIKMGIDPASVPHDPF
jgi:bifunctional DNA-binding transcriptional regulator/antitoxin component of YhaV-PrlF toxin-antitoxin module